MHTARDVITLALKKIGVLRSGGVATAADAADAMASLASFYQEIITNGSCGRIQDIPITRSGSATTGVNQHINVLTDDAVTLELPATVPYDYWHTWRPGRDYGWGLNVPLGGDDGFNVPRDKSVVRVTDQFGPARATYIYDGTVQRWLRLDTLALSDEAPLSARSFDGLASVLAIRLTELFGGDLASPVTVQSANRYKIALVTNHGNSEDYCG